MAILDTLLDLLVDTKFEALEGFALDHADALAALNQFTIDDVEITELSASRIEASFGENTLLLSGGQIDPVGSAEDLLTAIDTAFADASLTQLQLLDTSQTLLEFELTDDGFVFRSGDQALNFVGNWPGSLAEISQIASLLSETGNIADLPSEDRRSVVSLFDDYDFAQITLLDDNAPVFEFLRDGASVRFSSGDVALTASEGQEGAARTFSIQITAEATNPSPNFEIAGADLTDLPYTIPQIIEETGLDYTKQEIDRTVLLADHTYISYTLDQTLIGPYTFGLNIRVDEYFTDSIAPIITGTLESDRLAGNAADELFIGGKGNDIIDGGEGNDAARFSGVSGQFIVEITRDGVMVRDLRQDNEGIDILRNVETLKFDDLFVQLGDLNWVQRVTSEQVTDLVQLYIAYFGRLPDAQGIHFWLEAQDAGLSYAETARHFSTQPEAQLLDTEDLNFAALVSATYENVLGRAPDTEGGQFWSDALRSGDIDRPEFILSLLQGISTEPWGERDAKYVEDLTTLGTYYALEMGLGQVDDATALFDRYSDGILDVEAALTTIDQLADQVAIQQDSFAIALTGIRAEEL